MKNNELSILDKEIILAFAKYDMKAYRVSKKIYVCRGTVTYHCKKIKEKTNLDPRKFYDLCKLLEIVNERGDFYEQYKKKNLI